MKQGHNWAGIILGVVSLGTALCVVQGGCGGSAAGKGAAHPVERMPRVRPHEPMASLRWNLKLESTCRKTQASPLLGLFQKEIDRTMKGFRASGGCPAPYFVAYEGRDEERADVAASLGSLTVSATIRARSVNVDLRVGNRHFDNTHFLDRSWTTVATLPLDDDEAAVRMALWKATDGAYRNACRTYAAQQARAKTTPKPAKPSDDFSSPEHLVLHCQTTHLVFDRPKWETVARKLSNLFSGHPDILSSAVQISGVAGGSYMVSSEGTSIQVPGARYIVVVQAATLAPDGMPLARNEIRVASNQDGLPSLAELTRLTQTMISDLEVLRKAPVADPYEGPAIFRGRAAGVFFHEVFGHRMEGHRQKLRRSGQTFRAKLGQQIMPSFLSVFDDPRIVDINGRFANGHYLVDNEGMTAQRATLVDHGVLKGFLMSRIPIPGINRSNGHGRRQFGRLAVPRQANLVVEPHRFVTYEMLRAMLKAALRRQHKPYGLIFEDVSGGFTLTQRSMPQAFKVMPVKVYRMYLDGRRDELIRGVDMVGTPLLALRRIVAAGNDVSVFNGMCGAESGWVPVSATSPSLLISKVETQKKPAGKNRPPILPVPVEQSLGSSSAGRTGATFHHQATEASHGQGGAR
ncbi:MAG: peptidase U62 [Deltaproteobacteria bacterium]|nr:peptidase U62 [Deltaproteobacteria bacterium]